MSPELDGDLACDIVSQRDLVGEWLCLIKEKVSGNWRSFSCGAEEKRV